jgi:hypothetical protein
MQYHVVFEELGEKMIAVVVNDEKDLENLVLHYDKELFKLCYVERISDEFKQNWKEFLKIDKQLELGETS